MKNWCFVYEGENIAIFFAIFWGDCKIFSVNARTFTFPVGVFSGSKGIFSTEPSLHLAMMG